MGLFEGGDSPSGILVQIPGPVCFHFTTFFGFMIMMGKLTSSMLKIALAETQLDVGLGIGILITASRRLMAGLVAA